MRARPGKPLLHALLDQVLLPEGKGYSKRERSHGVRASHAHRAPSAMDTEEQHQAERRVRELLRRADTPETVESLTVNPGHLKLHSLAPLAKCRCLRRLDASRNALKSLEGAERLHSLEILNLYANKLGDLGELLRLQTLSFLTEVCLLPPLPSF